jgi:hypothetical protein
MFILTLERNAGTARDPRVSSSGATMPLLIHCRLAIAALALALAGDQALPQDAPRQRSARPQQQAPAGLPLYSSDGKMLGKVIATGVDDDGEPVLVAEIQLPLSRSRPTCSCKGVIASS